MRDTSWTTSRKCIALSALASRPQLAGQTESCQLPGGMWSPTPTQHMLSTPSHRVQAGCSRTGIAGSATTFARLCRQPPSKPWAAALCGNRRGALHGALLQGPLAPLDRPRPRVAQHAHSTAPPLRHPSCTACCSCGCGCGCRRAGPHAGAHARCAGVIRVQQDAGCGSRGGTQSASGEPVFGLAQCDATTQGSQAQQCGFAASRGGLRGRG